MSTDKGARSCEDAEDHEAAELLASKSSTHLELTGKEEERKKGGRELRPLKPLKAVEEVPRDILRARLPGPLGSYSDLSAISAT